MSDTAELTRAVVLLLGWMLEHEPEDELKAELASLYVVLGRRNRSGADDYNRDRRYRGAQAEVVLETGLAPQQPGHDGQPHRDTVAFNEQRAKVTADELVKHGDQLAFPDSRKQEL